MKTTIVFAALLGLSVAAPSLLTGPVVLARLTPGAPLGPDGRVVDTPEVAAAKVEHAAAQYQQRANLASQEARAAAGSPLDPQGGAPLGPDGRVVDTPEVALAKAQHASAQLAEKVNQANEAARNSPAIIAVAPPLAYPYVTLDRLYY